MVSLDTGITQNSKQKNWRQLMTKNQDFKDDIERAERAILAFSWMGAISALVVIGYIVGKLL